MFPEIARDDVFLLETRNLWLRWPRFADVRAIQGFCSEKSLAEMTSHIPHPYPEGAAEQFVFDARRRNTIGEGMRLALTMKTRPDALIGLVGLYPRGGKAPELGYWIGAPFRGRGLMSEAVAAVTDFAFLTMDDDLVHASARPENPASQAVLRRIGFQHTGRGMTDAPARGRPMVVETFGLTRKTWEARHTWATDLLATVAARASEERAREACGGGG